MVKHIIQIGDEILLKRSVSIDKSEIASSEVQSLIDDLFDTCEYYEEEAAGLSAVQIGTLKRVFLVRRVDIDRELEQPIWEEMINPEIENIDSSLSTEWEGCMSINRKGEKLFGPVKRPRKIKVTYTDREGNQKSLEADGFFSHLIQHELDHLNGTLFLKYVENPENIWREKELDRYLREHNSFPAQKA